MNTAALLHSLPERVLGAGCRMLFPGALSVHAAFAWSQVSTELCLVSCSSFFWKQALEPCFELAYKELILNVSWLCSQVLDIHKEVLPCFIKQLSEG